jgi:hypothetical protein
MEDSKDDNAHVILNEQDLIRKTTCQRAPDSAMHSRKHPGRSQDRTENGINTQKEGRSKSNAAVFVPTKRLCHLRFSFWANEEPSAHRLLLIRSRTIAQGLPSSGLRW